VPCAQGCHYFEMEFNNMGFIAEGGKCHKAKNEVGKSSYIHNYIMYLKYLRHLESFTKQLIYLTNQMPTIHIHTHTTWS